MMNVAYLRLENITKSFPGVLANSEINLSVEKGEIHALLGENGAGKSTLMKILYGYYQPDSGSMCFKARSSDNTGKARLEEGQKPSFRIH